jgi:DNA methylase
MSAAPKHRVCHRKSRKAGYPPHTPPSVLELRETFQAAAKVLASVPTADNAEGSVERMLHANAILRHLPWPKPFDETTHRVRCGDARDLSWLADQSVHLVVTSPPYWTLKTYEPNDAQLGAIADYEAFLTELDKAWAECARVLVPGGRICCVVGDVCIPRKREGRHYVMPLHADIQTRSRRLGSRPIRWHRKHCAGSPPLRPQQHYRGHPRPAGGKPISVGIVGINCAPNYTSYEGEREWPTNGKKHKHPIQEAEEAESRLISRAAPSFLMSSK